MSDEAAKFASLPWAPADSETIDMADNIELGAPPDLQVSVKLRQDTVVLVMQTRAAALPVPTEPGMEARALEIYPILARPTTLAAALAALQSPTALLAKYITQHALELLERARVEESARLLAEASQAGEKH